MLGTRALLDTERGYHLTLPHAGAELRLPVYSTERGFVCTPLEHGLRIAGTVELGGLQAAPDWRRAEVLYRNASRWFPDLDRREESRWMGYRSEEHTSELQSLMRISYAVFCLKKQHNTSHTQLSVTPIIYQHPL